VSTSGSIPESDHMTNQFMTYLDSPSTTSATTYKLQWEAESGETIYLNRSFGDGDASTSARGASSITVMEVGA